MEGSTSFVRRRRGRGCQKALEREPGDPGNPREAEVGELHINTRPVSARPYGLTLRNHFSLSDNARW